MVLQKLIGGYCGRKVTVPMYGVSLSLSREGQEKGQLVEKTLSSRAKRPHSARPRLVGLSCKAETVKLPEGTFGPLPGENGSEELDFYFFFIRRYCYGKERECEGGVFWQWLSGFSD